MKELINAIEALGFVRVEEFDFNSNILYQHRVYKSKGLDVVSLWCGDGKGVQFHIDPIDNKVKIFDTGM